MTATFRYDTALMRQDMAARGWVAIDLARASGVHPFTISKFLRGVKQTPRTAKRLAAALDGSPADYLIEDPNLVERRTGTDRRTVVRRDVVPANG